MLTKGVGYLCALWSLLSTSFLLPVAYAHDASGIPAVVHSIATDKVDKALAPSKLGQPEKQAQFHNEHASHAVRQFANWVLNSEDNAQQPFTIVDKVSARVYVFFADGRLRGAAPVLLGLAVGDHAVPGIGDRPLATIRPHERTTPAGRFVAEMDRNLQGKEILWVDYELAVSIHPVITSNRKERRLQRLNTKTALDNRISYGCINVPVNFFATVVRPSYAVTGGIVYVLPETKSLAEVFKTYSSKDQIVVKRHE